MTKVLFNTLQNYFIKYFSIDIRALGVFRVGLGVTLLYFLFNLSQDITMFYTDDGFLSRYDAMYLGSKWPFNWQYSIHLMSGNKFYLIALFAVQFASAIFFTLGYKTRLNCIISWFLLLSLQNRNHLILSGFDLYLRLLLFWSLFLPVHIKYSIDNLINKQQVPNPFFSSATFAIIVQVCVLYVFSALLKTVDDKWWVHNSALNYILHNEIYLTPIGYALHGYLSNAFLHIVTFSVLIIELITPVVLFMPTGKYFSHVRIFWFLVLLGLHSGFMLFMCIAPFTMVSVVATLLLLPSTAWDKFELLLSNFKFIKPKKILIKLFGAHFVQINNNFNINLSKITNVFILISVSTVITVNYASFNTKYKYNLPIIYEFATLTGLDQTWELFNRAATMSHMVRFFAIDEQNNERPIWPIDGYNVTESNIRQYFYATKNNWWWKYLIQINIPQQGYNYYKENNLIRALCIKENKKLDQPATKKVRVVYNWYPQIYDEKSNKITTNGKMAGWYYLNKCG